MRTPRRFVTTLTVLASLLLVIGSLVINEHSLAQKDTSKQDCEQLKKEITNLQEMLSSETASLHELERTHASVAQKYQDVLTLFKKAENSLNPFSNPEYILDRLREVGEIQRKLGNEIEEAKLTIQAIKDVIADLLNKLGNCSAKTSTPTPSPTPKPSPSPAPPVQPPPFQGVPGEGEDCSELRRSYNYQKQILSNPKLSPENRQQFEKALENSRSKYCKCLNDKHLSPLPEFCINPKSTATPAPTPAPTPAQNTSNQVGYHVGTNTANGLFVTTFDTPQGKIKVNLPDDMAAGDTISGTVETEPAGKDDAERAKNEGVLNGEVIDIGGQKTKVGDKKISCVIPNTLTNEARIVLQHNGQPVATTLISILTTPPTAPTQFTLPTGGQQGRLIQIQGPCNGVFGPQDSVTIGGTVVTPIAESPRQIIVQTPSNSVGQTTIQCNENGAKMECPFRDIGIKLTAPKLNLRRGETTTLHVVVTGLSGINQPVPLDLVNNSPRIISMSGGNFQNIVITPPLIQMDGTASFDRTLTGIMPGGFGVTATVKWDEICKRP